jgi:fluoroquinolone transport system permease protein
LLLPQPDILEKTMNAFKAVRALGPIDVQNIRRDSLLRWMVAFPLLMALMTRWLLPLMLRRAGELVGIDLFPFYPPLMGYALLLVTPALVGMIVGFLLLDQRDDHTLKALQVTPLSLPNYLAYRLTMPMAVSLLMTLVSFPLAGFNNLDLAGLLAAAMSAAPFAPIMALLLASFAENKVQGFALTKTTGVFFIAPVIAYFIGSSWQWLFGIVPHYWPARVYWAMAAGDSSAWLYLVIGLGYQGLLLMLLLRRFNIVAHR